MIMKLKKRDAVSKLEDVAEVVAIEPYESSKSHFMECFEESEASTEVEHQTPNLGKNF